MNQQNLRPENHRPQWRELSLLIPLMMGLLLLDGHMRLSTVGHQIIEIGGVLLMYGSLACWLWANQPALESESDSGGSWQKLGPTPGQSQPEVSLAEWVETAEEYDQRFDRTLSATAFQPVLYRQDVRCTPPSGARLN